MGKYILVLFTLFVAGCLRTIRPSDGAIESNEAYDSGDLMVYEDKDRGIVCYRVFGFDGLSCLKIKDQ